MANDTHPSPQKEATEALQKLLEVMARLRGDNGCPWDREQTHRSLIPYLLEETYELIEAIEHDDLSAVREELGDVLLQVVFHAQIESESGRFTFADVAADLAQKLTRRHPHVFGETGNDEVKAHPAGINSADDVSEMWHRNKMKNRTSALDGVPGALPALALASKIGGRAARAGFDWNRTGEILDKAAEELAEFRHEVEQVEADPGRDRKELETDFGDLLFAQVQLARWMGIDPESALRRTVKKFSGRFQWMEKQLQAQSEEDKKPAKEQWWALYGQAKAQFP